MTMDLVLPQAHVDKPCVGVMGHKGRPFHQRRSGAYTHVILAKAYLKIGRDEAEIEELEGHPELPVGNYCCLPVLLQLALNLV